MMITILIIMIIGSQILYKLLMHQINAANNAMAIMMIIKIVWWIVIDYRCMYVWVEWMYFLERAGLSYNGEMMDEQTKGKKEILNHILILKYKWGGIS